MAKSASAEFDGRSGRYSFEVFPLDTVFNAVGAVYIFTKRTVETSGRGTHEFLYIGETGSLENRIPNHEKLSAVLRRGANCICVHRDDNSVSRLKKETDLRAGNVTPYNDQ